MDNRLRHLIVNATLSTVGNILVTLGIFAYDSSEVVQQPTIEELEAQSKRVRSYSSKSVSRFCKAQSTTYDLDLLASFVYINEIPSHQYLAQQLSMGVEFLRLSRKSSWLFTN